MVITFLDTETTGAKVEDGDQIIEICLMRFQDGKHLETLTQRIRPTIRTISADAQRVHGIAMTDLITMPIWDTVAPRVETWLKDSDLIVAHNMEFDGSMIAAEQQRIGRQVPNKPTYCTMKNGRWACFDGKAPKLQELCFALGVSYDTKLAHAAEYDVERLAECYFEGKRRGFFK